MLKINFVGRGRGGTREPYVDEIRAFLGESHTPGYVSIWGAHGVGKSQVVDCALKEAEEQTYPHKIFIHRIVDHDYKSLSPEHVAFSIADHLGQKRPYFSKRKSSFNESEEKSWDDFVDWIDLILTSHGLGASSVVIWLSVSDLDISHSKLARLFKGNLGRTATRKLILEQQRVNYYQWKVSEPFYEKSRKLKALSESEASELLSDILKQILDKPDLVEAARTKILSLCSTHPGLIVGVCRHWESKLTPGSCYRSAQDVVKALSDMIDESYERYFAPDVRLILDCLTDAAKSRLADLVHGRMVEIPDEIRDTGVLMADGRVAELIERFLKTPLGEVFISYNHEDKAEADRVTEALRQRNIKVWIDSSGIPVGTSWLSAIGNAISSASAIVVLVSNHGLGGWQEKEVEVSLANKGKDEKLVIPVLLPGGPEPSELPPFLSRLQWIDFRGGFLKDAIDNLERALRGAKLRKE